jgi:hypothetical protein
MRRLEDSISLMSLSVGTRRPVARRTRSTSSALGANKSIHVAAPRSSLGSNKIIECLSWLRPLDPREPIPAFGSQIIEIRDERPLGHAVCNGDVHIALARGVPRTGVCGVRQADADPTPGLPRDGKELLGRSVREPRNIAKLRWLPQSSRLREVLGTESVGALDVHVRKGG